MDLGAFGLGVNSYLQYKKENKETVEKQFSIGAGSEMVQSLFFLYFQEVCDMKNVQFLDKIDVDLEGFSQFSTTCCCEYDNEPPTYLHEEDLKED